jgi:hypothetical protein
MRLKKCSNSLKSEVISRYSRIKLIPLIIVIDQSHNFFVGFQNFNLTLQQSFINNKNMKKLLLSIGLFTLASLTFAQGTKINLNPRASVVEKKNKPGSSTKAVTGSLVCNTFYVAGTTMNLSFTLNLTNTDEEFCDLFTLTFPAGITPNSSPNNPLVTPAISPQATGTQLNTISGQTISWGTDDDVNQYGGIAPGAPINFTVNVTIAPGTSGNLVANFVADGDTYIAPGSTTTASDLSGNVTIYSNAINNPNLAVLAVRPFNNIPLDRTCSYTQDTVVAFITNIGNTTENNAVVNFSLNGGAAVQSVGLVNPNNGTPATSIAPGDTLSALFIPAIDFSGSGIKDLKAWVAIPGDINTSNDTIVESFLNTVPTVLSTTAYTNGIESNFDFESLLSIWNGQGIGFDISQATFHTGAQALYYTVNTNIGATAGNYETYLVLPCMDVVQGATYKISYWRKSNTSTNPATINGSTAIFAGSGQDIASLSTVVKPYSAITPNAGPTFDAQGNMTNPGGPWSKDSVNYTATTTGTIYFAIGAKGTVATGNGINVRLDDINIVKIQSSSLDENDIVSSVYPNPANDELNFKVNGKISSITINTLDGKVVKTATSSTVDVSDLSSGMYIYHVNVDGKIATGNFVKQ